MYLKSLGFCHPCGKPRTGSWLLAQVQPNAGHCRNMGSEPADRNSVSLSRNKNSVRQFHLEWRVGIRESVFQHSSSITNYNHLPSGVTCQYELLHTHLLGNGNAIQVITKQIWLMEKSIQYTVNASCYFYSSSYRFLLVSIDPVPTSRGVFSYTASIKFVYLSS